MTKPVIWNKVRAGTKIMLNKGQQLKGMNGQPRYIMSGAYFVTGFWADVCGLNSQTANGTNEVVIKSTELSNFVKA